MIVIYPMLVSKNISPNILPAACKMLERFVLVYDMDSLSKRAGIGKIINATMRNSLNVVGREVPGAKSTMNFMGIGESDNRNGNFINEQFNTGKALKNEIKSKLDNRLNPSNGKTPSSDEIEKARHDLYMIGSNIDDFKKSGNFNINTVDFKDAEADYAKYIKYFGDLDRREIDSEKLAVNKDLETSKLGLSKDLESHKSNLRNAGEMEKLKKSLEYEKEKALYTDRLQRGEDPESARNAIKDIFFPSSDAQKFTTPRSFDQIQLEPTYVEVTSSRGQTTILGIKVVPFTVGNTDALIWALTNDMKIDRWIDYVMYKVTRKMFRFFYSSIRKIRTSMALDKPISGDPEKDIIFASTKYKNNVFVLFELSDLKGNEFFKNNGGLGRIFGLGWNSILIGDEVNKKLNFCMKQFGGLCSSIPYTIMHGFLGKDVSTEFKSLEDLDKNTKAFFSVKKSSKSIIGESLAQDKIGKMFTAIHGED